MRRSVTLLATIGLIMALEVVPVMAAPGGGPTVSSPLAEGLITPLGLAVGSDGTVYVAQTFAGTLTAIDKRGRVKDIAFAGTPGGAIAGVAALGKGTVSYTETGEAGPGEFIGLVQRVLPNGKVKTLADTVAYEETYNPDFVNSYGFQDLDDDCRALVPPEVGGFAYDGIVDSNPYAVEIMGGSRIVADAAGNDILRVAANGTVSTIAVLPPIPFVVTAAVAGLFDLPGCVIGATYKFEAVPTDVELGPDGMLYVSALPGGPEDDSLGARGAVFTVNPTTGAVTMMASGFLSAVDLAVAPDGTVYVAELFGGRISKVSGGSSELVVEVNEPGAIEWAQGKLYATINTFGNGAVVTIAP